MNELHRDRLEKRITEEEFSRRLDKAISEEAKKHRHLGPLLVRQALESEGKAIADEQKQTFEEKARQDRIALNQQRQRQLSEENERLRKEKNEQMNNERKEREEQAAKEQERLLFREMTGSSIIEREEAARRLQRQYNIWQIILLVFSAGTATLAGIDGVARGWVALTGFIATIAGGMLTTFKI